ncbi:hypothetical protein SLEP1_g43759 [Rubroshorea leprosula]|uniref:Reverse transcriptase domain-containing protein n=1 Tax=Rubroshorea leprosula TaxID=152421 RepID=A0AAV5LF32_9ROSI|nr:hypothetical protein SLEP1_g43759 [Rubroshorea leprosula]
MKRTRVGVRDAAARVEGKSRRWQENREAADLWHRFAKYGIMVDVYVLRKRDKWGKKFGLVRMAVVQNKAQMEKRLNEIWIGYYKMRVKIVDNGRNQESRNKKAVVGNRSEEERVDARPENVKERFKDKRCRLAWLCISGVPLQAWNDRCFEMVGRTVGEVVLIHDDTRRKAILCDGRVLVLCSNVSKVSKSIKLNVDEKFEIGVVEEEWRFDPDWWLLEGDRWSLMGTASKYSSMKSKDDEHELINNEISDEDDDSVDEESLHKEDFFNSRLPQELGEVNGHELGRTGLLHEQSKDKHDGQKGFQMVTDEMVKRVGSVSLSDGCIEHRNQENEKEIEPRLLEMKERDEMKGQNPVVEEKWNEMAVDGFAVANVECVDLKNEESTLEEDELNERHEGFQEIWDIMRKREALWKQKSRRLSCDGKWVEELELVKKVTVDYFPKLFCGESWNRPKPSSIIFKQISEEMKVWFGFGLRWRGWIKECLLIARISVLVNGSPTEEFMMGKGLRQGDPLSLFLFLMIAERLHGLVKKAKKEGLLHGIEVGSKGLTISLLQFVDDTVILGKANGDGGESLWKQVVWDKYHGGRREADIKAVDSVRVSRICKDDLCPRLFELAVHKEGLVCEMGVREGELWRWNIEWRRGRLGRERGKEEVLWEVLSKVQITKGLEDCWKWMHDAKGRYAVKKAYEFLSLMEFILPDQILMSWWGIQVVMPNTMEGVIEFFLYELGSVVASSVFSIFDWKFNPLECAVAIRKHRRMLREFHKHKYGEH